MSFVCVDEFHYIEQSGRHFRPEFRDALKFIQALLRDMPTPIPRILMSATATTNDIQTATSLLGKMTANVVHGPLDRRSILFKVVVSGDATPALIKSAKKDFKVDPRAQQIWYTHSRTKAEGPLRDRDEKALEENVTKNGGPQSVAVPFVGTDGIMMKTANMDAIKNYASCHGHGTILDPGAPSSQTSSLGIALPKVQLVIATKSAEAGINGPHLKYGKASGMPASLYELVQQLGRVDRKGTSTPGSNTYEVHLDFNCYVSLFMRIMTCSDSGECKRQLEQLHLVMQLLLMPSQCYHMAIEKHFEFDEDREKEPCHQFCLYCLGQCALFTKRVNRHGVVSFLTQRLANTNEFLVTNLIKTSTLR